MPQNLATPQPGLFMTRNNRLVRIRSSRIVFDPVPGGNGRTLEKVVWDGDLLNLAGTTVETTAEWEANGISRNPRGVVTPMDLCAVVTLDEPKPEPEQLEVESAAPAQAEPKAHVPDISAVQYLLARYPQVDAVDLARAVGDAYLDLLRFAADHGIADVDVTAAFTGGTFPVLADFPQSVACALLEIGKQAPPAEKKTPPPAAEQPA